jgi:hypothetical protein
MMLWTFPLVSELLVIPCFRVSGASAASKGISPHVFSSVEKHDQTFFFDKGNMIKLIKPGYFLHLIFLSLFL